jgi:AbrB family looped-hinge helix DNA binding protein
MKSTVSEKGQVTIPKPLREKLGLRTGEVLEFETRDGVLLARKAVTARTSLDSVVGILKGKFKDVDAQIDKLRGKPWNPKDDATGAHRR